MRFVIVDGSVSKFFAGMTRNQENCKLSTCLEECHCFPQHKSALTLGCLPTLHLSMVTPSLRASPTTEHRHILGRPCSTMAINTFVFSLDSPRGPPFIWETPPKDAMPLLGAALGGHWLVLGSLTPWSHGKPLAQEETAGGRAGRPTASSFLRS